MSSRMVSRGSKTRLFAFVCVVLVLSAVLFVFQWTQVELDRSRHSASSCSHQLESISSQLQVIVEHKLKLERSLEDEKSDHLKTREKLDELIQEEKQLRNKQADSVVRYNEIERTHEELMEEERKLRDELETLKKKYKEEEQKNFDLVAELEAALTKLDSIKYDNNKSDNAKENTEIDQNNNLQVPNEVGDLKLSDNINSTKSKLSSVTPAINPQAIDGATAKSSTPMIGLNLPSSNESLNIENNEANPINQPSMDIHNPVKLPDTGLVSPNETSSTQESLANGNESMKAMPAPPQEEIVNKYKSSDKEEPPKQANNAFKYEYEQDHVKEDEDDEDMNDFDAREDNQPLRYAN